MIALHYFNSIQRAKDVFHQFLVDVYAVIGNEILAYIRNRNFKMMIMAVRVTLHVAGKLVVLSSSFIVAPRYMYEKTIIFVLPIFYLLHSHASYKMTQKILKGQNQIISRT